MGVYDQEADPNVRDEPAESPPVPAEPPQPEQPDDRPDVEPNEESPDVDAPTPAHPDSTPDDEPAAEAQGYGVQGVEAFKG